MQKIALGIGSRKETKSTRSLLTAGVIAGPLFIIVPLIEMFIRPGFDIKRHAISVLSLGDLGWIQIGVFVLTGLLTIACAVGMRRIMYPGPSGTWGPLLIGAFGFGMIMAGIFPTDPGFGFPPDAPEGMPASMSWHAILHSVAFFLAFSALPMANFVFVRRFASMRQVGWAAYCLATGVAFFIAGIMAVGWVAAMAAQLFTDTTLENE